MKFNDTFSNTFICLSSTTLSFAHRVTVVIVVVIITTSASADVMTVGGIVSCIS